MAVLFCFCTESVKFRLHRLLATLHQLVDVVFGHSLGRDLGQNLHYHPSPSEALLFVIEESILGHDDLLNYRLRIDSHVEGTLLEGKQRILVVTRAFREYGQFELEGKKIPSDQ